MITFHVSFLVTLDTQFKQRLWLGIKMKNDSCFKNFLVMIFWFAKETFNSMVFRVRNRGYLIKMSEEVYEKIELENSQLHNVVIIKTFYPFYNSGDFDV